MFNWVLNFPLNTLSTLLNVLFSVGVVILGFLILVIRTNKLSESYRFLILIILSLGVSMIYSGFKINHKISEYSYNQLAPLEIKLMGPEIQLIKIIKHDEDSSSLGTVKVIVKRKSSETQALGFIECHELVFKDCIAQIKSNKNKIISNLEPDSSSIKVLKTVYDSAQ